MGGPDDRSARRPQSAPARPCRHFLHHLHGPEARQQHHSGTGEMLSRANAQPSLSRLDAINLDVRFGAEADAPSYWITSSARATNAGGTARPSAFGGPEVDREIEFCRKLNRKIARLLPRENPGHVNTRAVVSIRLARAITD